MISHFFTAPILLLYAIMSGNVIAEQIGGKENDRIRAQMKTVYRKLYI